ncbi:MATE family efflux transporter [Halosolutus gelatinilyticus]|uniref:MATE family efflux transporter n=1 Tax=Halosolutus gelatinilyticus TaxID=2931975 RepID=UPI001FF3E7F8|nr:MATE family efflux transporter [Halosolutus gelatinilyticus]
MFDLDRDEITSGPIAKTLVILAGPLLVQNLVQVLQQVIDTLWLGRHSLEGVAAVGVTFPIIGLLAAVAVGAGVGTQVLVSQRVGADESASGRRAAVNGIGVGLIAGSIVGLVVWALAGRIVGIFGASEVVTRYAAAYLATFALAVPLTSASEAIESSFIGWGDTRAALYINALSVAVNLVLDPFLIFGWWVFPGLGVAGAALATAIGYGFGLALGIGMAVRGRDGFVITRADCELALDDCREIVDIGWPTAGQYVTSQSARVGMVWLVALVGGATGLAAYTIGARVATISFVPAIGLQQAAQSMIGQNLGAELPDRARRTTWIGVVMASVGLTVIGAVQWAIPGILSALFVPDATTAELAAATEYLRILAYGYWAIGAMYLLQAGFNGARRTRTSLIATLLQYWIVRIPIAAAGAFVLNMGVTGVFWGVTLSNVAAAIGLGCYYRLETSGGMNERAAKTAAAEAAD